MNPAQVLLAVIGLGAAGITYCLMRFPRMRRDRFRQCGAFSVTASLGVAAAVFAVFALVILVQGAWRAG